MNTPTPRTDDQIGYEGSTMTFVRIDFARQLERELAEAQASKERISKRAEAIRCELYELDKKFEEAEEWQRDMCAKAGALRRINIDLEDLRDDLKKQLAESQAREAQLREALARIAKAEDAPDIDATGEWQTGLHCGVEDRDCRDRYEGADYGHTVGVERTLEWASNEATAALSLPPPLVVSMTDALELVEAVAFIHNECDWEPGENGDSRIGTACLKALTNFRTKYPTTSK